MTFASYFTCIMFCISVRVKGFGHQEELVTSDENESNFIGRDMFLFGKLHTNESSTITPGSCFKMDLLH